MNTTNFMEIANAICPDRAFMVFEGQKWTYAEANQRIINLANALGRLGIQKGDRIGIIQVNCNQYIEAYFAAARLGAIFVPFNFRSKGNELTQMINNAGAKLLFVGARYLAMVEEISSRLATVRHYICLDKKQNEIPFYEDLISAASTDDLMSDIDDEDITILMYTAGTTGRPKGVPLKHSGFVSYVLDNVEPPNPEEEERNLLTVPLYHVAGMQAVLSAVYGGRTLILMRQFEAKEWLQTVQNERAMRAMLVPTMLKWVIDDPDFHKYDLSSLSVITYGAAPMPFPVIKTAMQKMPWVRFINAFGQTETASTITALGPEDHIIKGTEQEKEKKWKRLAASIGKPLPDVEIKIVDGEGNVLPPGKVGDILAKGPRIMTGYWDDEEKTSQVMTADGWLRTGDKGWIDEDGYIYLAGRGDDMIIRGGENISPEEVEDVLHAHPKVEEAAVIGVPDPEWGQEPRAIIVLKKDVEADADEILEFCRPRLAGFKRPRSVTFIDRLPRNHMGKVLMNELREQYGKIVA